MNKKFDFLTKNLVDQAVIEVDKNGIPSNRQGTTYAFLINGNHYPFKLLLTEAAKLANVNLTSSDFSSNENDRKGFEKLTGYKIIDLNKNMKFKDLNELVEITNATLGGFCSKFQYKRKELLNMGSTSNRKKLFIYTDANRDWAINSGGGTELQYHIFLRENRVGYGLGFNTQYVPYANDKSSIEYIKPYVKSFLATPELQEELMKAGFEYVFGDENMLLELVDNKYVLLGKTEDVNFNNGQFELSETFFQMMMNDIKGVLFETYQKVLENMNTNNSELSDGAATEINKYIELLKFKNQIILQGPPGTGKTRMAEELAKLMTQDNAQEKKKSSLIFLSDAYIKGKLQNVKEIPSSTNRTQYDLSNILNDRCTVSLKSGTSYDIPYVGIKRAYDEKLWLGGQKNGYDSYDAAIAKYLFETKDIQELVTVKEESKDYDIIQFHPSFSYEDFVRGITVKNVGNQIIYKTENKLLGKLAQKANDNLIKSKQPIEQNLKQKWVEEQLVLFTDTIQQTIDEHGKYELTPNVGIVAIDEDAYRYTGENWANENTNRMRFFDIVTAMLTNVNSRQDIKRHATMSGSSIQHATYYYNLLEKFKAFIKEPIPEKFPSENATEVKNYVLIIDEINRANLPAVLGELIYALEYRGQIVKSMYDIDGNHDIVLPKNLFIIGTMNTADRSVGQIDYAIRRRFAFVDVLPKILDEATLDGHKFALDKFLEVTKLFVENFNPDDPDAILKSSEHLSEEFRPEDIWLGHSYFIHDDNNLDVRLQYEIIPILKEYVKDGILKESAMDIINQLDK